MTAHRFLGEHDWYREGTDLMVRQQDKLSGFWKGLGYGENNPHIGTSFALLFLSKGRRPILMGKLQFGNNDDWNHHRGDAANLTSFVETRWRRDLSWQVVNAGTASVDDLLQAPVLFMCASQAPDINEPKRAGCASTSIKGASCLPWLVAAILVSIPDFALMRRVFPEREYELKLLPPDHPVWHAEQPIAPAAVRPLWGINVGCRTSVIYCPKSLLHVGAGRRPRQPAQRIGPATGACRAGDRHQRAGLRDQSRGEIQVRDSHHRHRAR